MPVTLPANTQLASHLGGFGDALGAQVSKEQATQTLKALHNYIRDGQGNLRAGDIRIVNTTNQGALAFKYKSFGWGPAHRTERTAQALVELLNKAGVADAQSRVDQLLKPKGAADYGRLSAESLSRLLGSPDVRAKIFSPRQQLQHQLQDQGYRNMAHLGAGGQGTTFLTKLAGQDKVVKLFVEGDEFKPQLMDGNRANRQAYGDYFASYLAAGRKTAIKPLVVTPQTYIMTKPAGDGFDMLTPQEVRQRAKAIRTGGQPAMQCVGLVMDKAPGSTLDKMDGFSPGNAASVGLAKSGLQTLRALNERGLLHRDIKPDNMTYDAKRREAHFFDTGFMFKVRKQDSSNTGVIQNLWAKGKAWLNAENVGEDKLPIKALGTNGYSHPAVLQGKPCGSQQDLHSFALTLMEKSYPGLKPRLIGKATAVDSGDLDPAKVIAGHELLDRMRELAEPDSRAISSTREDARKFLADFKDPRSFAHFIHSALMLAETDTTKKGIAPAEWANREFSNQKLEQLMAHPALSG